MFGQAKKKYKSLVYLELDPIRGNCMPDRSSSLGDHRMSRCLALDLGNSDLLLL
jgi:hypothetical protein